MTQVRSARRGGKRLLATASNALATLIVCAGLWAQAAAAALPNALSTAMKAERIPADRVGFLLLRLDDQRVIAAHNTQRPLNPASLMKLVTTYAALELLGPSYSFPTVVWTDREAVDGRLEGNLYLQGSGDPKFTEERLWFLLRELRGRGVRDITGNLVLDRSAFSLPPHDPAAFDGQPLRPYNAGADALLVNFSAIRLRLSPDPAKGRLLVWQDTPDERVSIDNRVTLVPGECGDWREAITVQISAYRIELGGTFAAGCGDKPLSLSLANGDAHVEGLFRTLWRELGGSFTGQVTSGSVPPFAQRLAEHQSPPLGELVRDTNKFSNNVMARQIFLALAAERPATEEAATRRLGEWLASHKVDPAQVHVANGSGLSRDGTITIDALRRLMVAAWNSPVMPEYLASLPILGRDGTLRRRLTDSPQAGRAHLKTGTLADVKATAGYLVSQQAQRYLLIAVTNHSKAAALQPCIDKIIESVLANDRLPARCR